MSSAAQRLMIADLRAAIAAALAAEEAAEVRADIVAALVDHTARGNRKLPQGTAILNYGAATDCAADARGFCAVAARCYARKAERLYRAVLPYRRRQGRIMAEATAAEIAAAILEVAARYGVSALRLSEAGDFRSQSDVNKAAEAARILARHGITTYCYTARRDLDYREAAEVMTINGSGFAPPRGNRFTAATATECAAHAAAGGLVCGGDCRRCRLCLRDHGREVLAPLH